MYSRSDRECLRRLAGKVRELAELPETAERRRKWTALNDRTGTEPMVLVSPEGAWREIDETIELHCTDPEARNWELGFHHLLIEHGFGDDLVLDGRFPISPCCSDTGWGVELKKALPDDPTGAYKHIPPIVDFERDFPKLKFRRLIYDQAETQRRVELAEKTLGDLLEVVVPAPGYRFWSCGLTRDVLDLVGMEKLLYGMYDNPDQIHQLMQFLSDDYAQFLDQLEAAELLNYNNADTGIGSGGWGRCSELPSPEHPVQGRPVRCCDLWGLGESQETVGVSPEMFAEFIWPYQKRLLERFGLVYYGCCEPVESRLDSLRELPQLRALSVSPWSDVEKVAAAAGRELVLYHKPNPGLVCVSFCEEEIRADLRHRLDAAKGCSNAFVLKDTHTISHQPERFRRWVEIAREEFARS